LVNTVQPNEWFGYFYQAGIKRIEAGNNTYMLAMSAWQGCSFSDKTYTPEGRIFIEYTYDLYINLRRCSLEEWTELYMGAINQLNRLRVSIKDI
jgi:hypothetical protein